jgi:glutamine---fructose-6-phosphate transaminase (isomerizing)
MTSFMHQELRAAPAVVAHQIQTNAAQVKALAQAMRATPLRALITLGRGSSDHASAYTAYQVMKHSGLIVTSMPSSLLNWYGMPRLDQSHGVLAFSQSGRSPDLVQAMERCTASGAQTVAWVNQDQSPLAGVAAHSVGLHAGAERSVAATKSCLAQMSAGLHWLAHWQNSSNLQEDLEQLPDALRAALLTPTDQAVAQLLNAQQLFVVGRGASLALAQEMALKFQEVCGIHAQAYSSAEVHHGPMALVQTGLAALVVADRGEALGSVTATAKLLRERGATVVIISAESKLAPSMPLKSGFHESLDGLMALQAFYAMVEELAIARGRNPDQPQHLAKVTQTH